MTDKQIIIDDQKKTIHRLQDECIEKTNAIITLGEQLKTKEQECEELKKQHQSDKGLITSTGKQNHQLIREYDKLKTAVAEIKEIAEIEIECKTYEIENDCFNETRCKALNEHIDFIKQILQKISECEVEDEHS